jgi:hypothetical protein
LGEEALAGGGDGHGVGIAPEEGGAAALLEGAELAAQGGLGDFQAAGAGGDAAALDDADEGAEQGEVFKRGGHAIYA